MNIKTIAEYMVKEGIKNTNECNWGFNIEEIALHFNISIVEIKKNSKEILRQVDSMEEVAECSYENDDTFYITFYTDFCN